MRGCARIIHGGDIGKPEVLAALAAIAPVTAVRGNNDRARWADGIPDSATLDFWGGVGEPTICVVGPSVLNAVYAATGKPMRELPLRHSKLA